MLTAIIVAGGSSRRMGFDKTFALLAGKPVIAHSVAAFETADCVRDIIVVGHADHLTRLQEALSGFGKVRDIVPGGVHRHDSVAEGLKRASGSADFVAVHDAARPLVRPGEVQQVYDAALKHGAAALAAPVVDTLKRADAAHTVRGSVDREHLYAMQTPQIFSRELLLRAYAHVAEHNLAVTDEVSAVEALGERVVLVPTQQFNFKLTYPVDLNLAELVLASRNEERAGI